MNSYHFFPIGIIAGIFFDAVVGFLDNFRGIERKLFGRRVHHSIYGIALITIGIFIYTEFLVGLGLGIILSHTARLKKLIFVEKLRGKKSKK